MSSNGGKQDGKSYETCLSSTLTSFSPHMWLTVEPEAGLEAGPITETTPLGRIWHTEREQNKKGDKQWISRHTPFLLVCFEGSAALAYWRGCSQGEKRGNLNATKNSEDALPFQFNHSLYCCSTICLIIIWFIFEGNPPRTTTGQPTGCLLLLFTCLDSHF